jgi:hypothetical protein
MRLILASFLMLMIIAFPAFAQEAANAASQVDLILPPQLETPDAPFYRGAAVKMGNDVMPVVEGKLPNGVVAQFQPERRAVVVSNDSNISENRKGQALMDVVTTLQTAAIQTAAGTEK